MKRLLAILTAALLAVPLAAQKSADATATVTVVKTLNLANVTGLNFGNHFKSEGIVTTTAGQGASWSGSTDPSSNINATFALPAALVKVGGASVPFACNNMSALLTSPGATDARFNPASGMFGFATGSTGAFAVSLGEFAGDVFSTCSVDVTGAATGVYTGVVTLTISF